jgi:secondary thiamine-phosphate synthase enzyme
MLRTLEVRTTKRAEFVDITSQIQTVVKESGAQNGICVVHVPHTTAALTINENADPSVTQDILGKLNELAPRSNQYAHAEGNSDAHIKASMMGFQVVLMVERGRLQLGTWQAVYLTEFDGPRTRRVLVKVSSD